MTGTTGTNDLQDPYFLEHLRRAIAEDPRVGEPAVRVFSAAGRIWLEGFVGSEERRKATEDLVAEMAPGIAIKNELQVIVLTAPSVESVDR